MPFQPIDVTATPITLAPQIVTSSEVQGSPVLDVLLQILWEIRALRLAFIDVSIGDGAKIKEQDFDPALLTNEVSEFQT